jgi:quercetin dioxygenase-like cupin family protein
MCSRDRQIVETMMNTVRAAVAFLLLCVHGETTLAQQPPAATTVRTVMALTTLPSVVSAPLFFKLAKVELAAGQTTKYAGPVGFIYVLAGSVEVHTEGSQRALKQDDALLVSADKPHSVSAAEAASFLHWVLARSEEVDIAAAPPAVVSDLYRTPRAIPDLKPGRHEFTLTRVSYPPRMAPNAPHYRSGAALYYIRAGNGIFIADGKTEIKEAGRAHFEPHGWVHQWGVASDTPLVLLQANISAEGTPAVIFPSPPGAR